MITSSQAYFAKHKHEDEPTAICSSITTLQFAWFYYVFGSYPYAAETVRGRRVQFSSKCRIYNVENQFQLPRSSAQKQRTICLGNRSRTVANMEQLAGKIMRVCADRVID